MSLKSKIRECQEEEDLRLVLEYKAKWFHSRADHDLLSFNLERKVRLHMHIYSGSCSHALELLLVRNLSCTYMYVFLVVFFYWFCQFIFI